MREPTTTLTEQRDAFDYKHGCFVNELYALVTMDWLRENYGLHWGHVAGAKERYQLEWSHDYTEFRIWCPSVGEYFWPTDASTAAWYNELQRVR